MDKTESTKKRLKANFGPRIVLQEDIGPALAEYLLTHGYAECLLVADENTWQALGREIAAGLKSAGVGVRECLFAGVPRLEPTLGAVEKVESLSLPAEIQVVLAVGSGVINDIVRFASFRRGLPYLSLPTAPSMDGYTSSVAPLLIAGLKVTKPAQAPEAVFASLKVLQEAPWEFIQAGAGDLLGKAVSLLDWKLSHELFGESLSEEAYRLVREPLLCLIRNAEAVARREPEAIKNLLTGLLNSGIAMAMVGNSRPASGSEHHCSHYWDFLQHKGLREYAAHGLQVGYATYWLLEFYRKLLVENPCFTLKPLELGDRRLNEYEDFFGEAALEIIQAQKEKREWLRERSVGKMIVDRQTLEPLREDFQTFSQATHTLGTLGVLTDRHFSAFPGELLRQTFLQARLLRSRYTIFDLLLQGELLETYSEDILARGLLKENIF